MTQNDSRVTAAARALYERCYVPQVDARDAARAALAAADGAKEDRVFDYEQSIRDKVAEAEQELRKGRDLVAVPDGADLTPIRNLVRARISPNIP